MKTICGSDCCENCSKFKHECKGCLETNGKPCGGRCVAAECFVNGGIAEFQKQKEELIEEINRLNIPNLHINDLNLLNGDYINLSYSDIHGNTYKLLEDKNVYFANQVEIPKSEKCFGIACDKEVIVISKYGSNGSNPELIFYRKRVE